MVFHLKTVESLTFRSSKGTECPQATYKELHDLVTAKSLGSKNKAPRGTPTTYGNSFEVFEVLGGVVLPSASWEVFWAALG